MRMLLYKNVEASIITNFCTFVFNIEKKIKLFSGNGETVTVCPTKLEPNDIVVRIHHSKGMNLLLYVSQADGQDLPRTVLYPTD